MVYKYIIFLLLFLVFATPFLFVENINITLLEYAGNNYVVASFIYILLLIVSVVVAPFTMPLFLVSGGIFGPLVAAIYNVIGWSAGAIIAFLLARFLGRPILSRFISIKKIDEYEKNIPKKLEFLGIVLLRMIMPVDLLSYALGFFSNISFMRYMMATVIGITPFAIVFAYGGDALFNGEYFIVTAVVALALVAFGISFYFFKRNNF